MIPLSEDWLYFHTRVPFSSGCFWPWLGGAEGVTEHALLQNKEVVPLFLWLCDISNKYIKHFKAFSLIDTLIKMQLLKNWFFSFAVFFIRINEKNICSTRIFIGNIHKENPLYSAKSMLCNSAPVKQPEKGTPECENKSVPEIFPIIYSFFPISSFHWSLNTAKVFRFMIPDV